MFKNFGLKISALLLAIVFWIFLLGLQNSFFELPQSLTVQAFNLSPDLALREALPAVKIKLSTPDKSKRPQNLSPEDFEAYVDLQNLTEGPHDVQVAVTSKRNDVSVASVSPKTLSVEIVATANKKVPLKIVTKGKAAEGFEMKALSNLPGEITVKSSEDRLASIVEAQVVIELKGDEKEGFNVQLEPIALDGGNNPLKGIVFEPAKISLEVPIGETEITKVVGVELNLQGDSSHIDLIKTQIVPQTIVIQGAKDVLEGISTIKTELLSASSLLKPGAVAADLELPENVKLKKGEPASVIINVFIKKQ